MKYHRQRLKNWQRNTFQYMKNIEQKNCIVLLCGSTSAILHFIKAILRNSLKDAYTPHTLVETNITDVEIYLQQCEGKFLKSSKQIFVYPMKQTTYPCCMFSCCLKENHYIPETFFELANFSEVRDNIQTIFRKMVFHHKIPEFSSSNVIKLIGAVRIFAIYIMKF